MMYKRIMAVLLSALIAGSAVSLPASAQSAETSDVPSISSGSSQKKSVPFASGYSDDETVQSVTKTPHTHETETANLVRSGYAGAENYESVQWELYDNGTLYFYGAGSISRGDYCWAEYPVISVVIETGITGIGYGAFQGCDSLLNVEIGADAENIDSYAFEHCFNLNRITIPSNVQNVAGDAFAYCEKLSFVRIAGSNTFIDSSAFTGCNNIKTVILSGDPYYGYNYNMCTLFNIPEEAYESSIFTERTHNADHQSVSESGQCGENVFWELHSDNTLYIYGSGDMYDYGTEPNYDTPFSNIYASSVVVEYGVEHIGAHAFENLNYNNLEMSESVTSIGQFGLGYDLNSKTIFYGGTREKFIDMYMIDDYLRQLMEEAKQYPEDEYLQERANEYYRNMEEYLGQCNITFGGIAEPGHIIRGGYLGYQAFWALYDNGTAVVYGNGDIQDFSMREDSPFFNRYEYEQYYNGSGETETFIKKVIIEDGITRIGRNTFSECVTVNSITIPESVTSIGEYAFSGCSQLTDVVLPSSLTTIEQYAFGYCDSLKEFVIPAGVQNIGENALGDCYNLTDIKVDENNNSFKSVNGVLFTKDMSKLIQYPGGKEDTSYTIPTGVTIIGSGAFNSNSKLSAITIPAGVHTIESYAFNCCSQLSSIAIPAGVTFIGSNAFSNCSNLSSVTLPAGLATIESYAFSSCKFDSISIPSTVTKIGSYAFSYCSNLVALELPAGLTSFSANVINSCGKLKTITLPKCVKTIDSYDFNYCYSLESINVAADNPNLTSVDGVVFSKDKTTLIKYPVNRPDTSYTIPTGTKKIVFYAFYQTKDLKSIDIPASVETIENRAFYDIANLEAINVDDTSSCLSSSDGILFNKDKTTLIVYPENKTGTSYIIPESVTNISEYAFYNCKELTAATITSNVKDAGSSAFQYCSNLETVKIQNGLTYISNSMFSGCRKLESITIPVSVKKINMLSFLLCNKLKNVYYTGSASEWNAITKDSSTSSYLSSSKLKTNSFANYSNVSSSTIYLGEPIVINGVTEGGSGICTFSYYYKKSTASSWNTIKEGMLDTTASFKPGYAVAYDVKIIASDPYGPVDTQIVTVNVVEAPLNNTSTISQAITLGESISIKGAATGGTAPYKYSYYYKKSSASNWNTKLENTTSTSTSFKPGAAVSYDVKVVVTDAKGKTETKTFTCPVTKALVNSSSVPTAVKLGSSITIKGAASGGTAPYTYSYYYKKSSVNNWNTKLKDTTTTSTSFKPGAAVPYDIKVIVKDAAGKTAAKIYTCDVTSNDLTNKAVVSTDITFGESISIKGAASGGTAPYKYSYYYKKSSVSNWNTKLENTTTTSTSFRPGAAVPYDIKVVVTDASGKKSEKIITCTVTKALVNNSTVTDSIKLGESVSIKGAASGGTAPYKYSYYYKRSTAANWNTKLENTTSTSTSFKPGAAVSFDVKVVVTDAKGKTAEKIYTVKVS